MRVYFYAFDLIDRHVEVGQQVECSFGEATSIENENVVVLQHVAETSAGEPLAQELHQPPAPAVAATVINEDVVVESAVSLLVLDGGHTCRKLHFCDDFVIDEAVHEDAYACTVSQVGVQCSSSGVGKLLFVRLDLDSPNARVLLLQEEHHLGGCGEIGRHDERESGSHGLPQNVPQMRSRFFCGPWKFGFEVSTGTV